MLTRGLLCGCLTAALAVNVVAQEAVKSAPSMALDFRYVRLIKPVADADVPSVQIEWTPREREEALSGVVTKYRTETRTRSVPVTKMRTEQRTRKVPVTTLQKESRVRKAKVGGKEVEVPYTVEVPVTTQQEQTYTVQVPYTETVEQTYSVQIPYQEQRTGPRRVAPSNIKIADLKAWDLGGEKVSADPLTKRLSKPTAAFLLRRPLTKGTKIDPAHLAILRPDTLFLYVQPESKKSP